MAENQQLVPTFGAGHRRAVILRRCLAGVIAAALGGATLYSGAGFALSAVNPVLASSMASGHAGTLSNLTQLRFLGARSRDDLPAVADTARRTVQVAPLDHAAARTYAAVDLVGNRRDRAERVFALVGANTLRDAMTHAWLLNFAYRDREFGKVVRQADIALRLDPKLRPAAFAALEQLVADGRVIPALSTVLQSAPPWRTGFLETMGQDRGARENKLRLLRLLRQGDTPPTEAELRTFFLTQANRVSVSQLERDYRELAPHGFSRNEQLLRNGDMEGTTAFGPFTWTFYSGDNGFAELGPSPAGVGQSMYVDFEGRSTATGASQVLTMPPGAYLLSLRSFALTDLRGQTVLQLSCSRGAGRRALQARMRVFGTLNDWQRQSWYFTVPTGCGGPILDISWQPGTISRPEQLYLDDLTIRPTARRAAPPVSAPAPTAPGTPDSASTDANADD